jgi:hypothetical protein
MRRQTMSLGFIAAMMFAAPSLGADPSIEAAADTTAPEAADSPALERTAGAANAAIGRGVMGGMDNRLGPSVVFASVLSNSANTQVFRFFNTNRAAGAVTAKLYDAAAGTSLGAWTSASIPAGAAIEVSAATIAAGATPALTAAEQAAALNIAVTAAFRGTVQQITRTAGAIINQSDCGAGGGILSYVEGPGFTGVTGAVRMVNVGTAAGTITLSLRDAATGTALGAWTSASVPAHGAVTVTSAVIAAAATPVVPAATAALNIVPTAATARIEIEHVSSLTAGTSVANLSAACGL